MKCGSLEAGWQVFGTGITERGRKKTMVETSYFLAFSGFPKAIVWGLMDPVKGSSAAVYHWPANMKGYFYHPHNMVTKSVGP